MNFVRLFAIGIFAPAIAGCTSATVQRSADVPLSAFAAQTDTIQVDPQLIAALHGGIISQAPGAKLPDTDVKLALSAEYRALEYGQSGKAVEWTNLANGDSGQVVAAQPYRVGSQDCRSYRHTVFVTTGPISTNGTACRNADGSWTPLS